MLHRIVVGEGIPRLGFSICNSQWNRGCSTVRKGKFAVTTVFIISCLNMMSVNCWTGCGAATLPYICHSGVLELELEDEFEWILTVTNMVEMSWLFLLCPLADMHPREVRCVFMCVVPTFNALGWCRVPLQSKQNEKGYLLGAFAPWPKCVQCTPVRSFNSHPGAWRLLLLGCPPRFSRSFPALVKSIWFLWLPLKCSTAEYSCESWSHLNRFRHGESCRHG